MVSAGAYGTLDFLKMVSAAAYGTLDFLKMVSTAAYGTLDFLKMASAASYGTLDFLKMVSAAAYGTLDFLKMVSAAAYGTLDFLKMVSAAAYGTLDFLKMVLVGALVGAWSPTGNAVAQQAFRVLVGALVGAWSPTGNAPFTERGLQVVEAVSAGAEVVLFACALAMAIDWDMSSNFATILFPFHPPLRSTPSPTALHGARPAGGGSSELGSRGGAPFTERGLQVVEAVSSGAEVVLFACALAMAIDWDMSSNFAGTLGLVMALAVGLAFIGQLFNQ
ncbi:unnamed protein product [Closterium sp. Naga37s-1]|nr:unnamed protein product [Closterium sp. Naga37s-1]